MKHITMSRLTLELEVRIWVRETIGRYDVDLPSLKRLSDEDLRIIASAVELIATEGRKP